MAREGIDALRAWIEEIGEGTSLARMEVAKDMLKGIVPLTLSPMNVRPQGYNQLSRDGIRAILQESM